MNALMVLLLNGWGYVAHRVRDDHTLVVRLRMPYFGTILEHDVVEEA